jgi:hypothetical protein
MRMIVDKGIFMTFALAINKKCNKTVNARDPEGEFSENP